MDHKVNCLWLQRPDKRWEANCGGMLPLSGVTDLRYHGIEYCCFCGKRIALSAGEGQ